MNNPVLMLAAGLALGIVVGRALKQCPVPTAPKSATKTDVLVSLLKFGTELVD